MQVGSTLTTVYHVRMRPQTLITFPGDPFRLLEPLRAFADGPAVEDLTFRPMDCAFQGIVPTPPPLLIWPLAPSGLIATGPAMQAISGAKS
jgi:hypothetical protein